jgi:hypothetical protein
VCHCVPLCAIVCHCVPLCSIVCHGVRLSNYIITQLYNKIPINYYPTDFCVPVKRHSMVFHSVHYLNVWIEIKILIPGYIVFHGIQWCSMVFNGVQWCSMVFNGVQWCSVIQHYDKKTCNVRLFNYVIKPTNYKLFSI